MNFLAPWFLLGGLAIVGPILFHLIRRAARERMPFSSLMFLRPTPPRVTRRHRLENLWLLLLRCLCLLLLAAGFSRPFFSRNNVLPPVRGEARQIVLLLDTSASMRREGIWDQAKTVAERYLNSASPSDQIAIVAFDRRPRTLINFAEWTSWSSGQRASLARQRLGNVMPGWMGTHLGLALTTAGEQFLEDSLNQKPAKKRELVLISDLQEGAKLDGLQGHEWPAGVRVTIERIETKRHTNAGLLIADEPARRGGTNEIAVRVANARDSNQEKFQLSWGAETGGGSPGKAMDIYVPPGQTRTFPAPVLPAAWSTAQLRLSGDEETFDNTVYYARPEAERQTIAWFGSDSDNNPSGMRYYLQRVFSGLRQVRLLAPTNSLPAAELLHESVFAVIPGRLDGDESSAVREWLARGKTALLVLSDAQMSPTLAALTGFSTIQISEAEGNYALLGEVDFNHPIFSPFADPRFSDFTHIHFWKHRRLEIPSGIPARTLAKFDDGSPALVQLGVEKGQLLILTSGWNPADSQLAVSSKFPPMMQTMLDWSGAALPKHFQYLTGDSIPSPATSEAATVVWQKPDGKTQSLAANLSFTDTDTPGIYRATCGGKETRFAVNLSLDESRTAPLSFDELAHLGVPLATATEISATETQERQRHWQQTELENRQKLWRWLIVAVLAVTLGEIVLGGWLARRVKTVEVAA